MYFVNSGLETIGVWNISNNVLIPSNSGTRFSLTNDLKSDAAVYSLRLGYRLLEGGADSDSVYNFVRFHLEVLRLSHSVSD